jgi:NlpC/P60 family putative phage cell wall peptidase
MSAMQRAAVVAEARSWIGTPYHHAADVKGHGVDCALLLVRVYCDLGLVEPFDPRPYTRDWFLHRNEERYLGFLLARSHEVREPALGDIILFRIGRCFAHAGIVSRVEPLAIIHAFAPSSHVVEDVIAANADLLGRIKTAKFASYWG